MKYLVAGSTGLIGKNLINILSENHQVTALTRRDYKFPENVDQLILNYENSFELPQADHPVYMSWFSFGIIRSNCDARFCKKTIL